MRVPLDGTLKMCKSGYIQQGKIILLKKNLTHCELLHFHYCYYFPSNPQGYDHLHGDQIQSKAELFWELELALFLPLGSLKKIIIKILF